MAENTTGTAPATGSISATANAFEQLLTLEEEGTQPVVEAQGEQGTESDEGEDTGTPASEGQDDEPGTEGEESEGAVEGDEAPAAKLYTVRVDGKEEQVPEAELIAGYQRNRDYTQKTQAIANQRRELEQAKSTVSQERAEYAELLPRLRTMLEGSLKEPNWEELRAADPVKAAIEYDRFQERKAQIATLKAEEARVKAQQEREFAEMRNRVLIEEQAALLKRPEFSHWADEAKAAADSKEIEAVLRDAGYTDSELEIYDHRAMLIAWQAAQYVKLTKQRKAAQSTVQKKIAAAPVAKPGSGAVQSSNPVRKAQQRLAKSGSVRDAAALFESFMT